MSITALEFRAEMNLEQQEFQEAKYAFRIESQNAFQSTEYRNQSSKKWRQNNREKNLEFSRWKNGFNLDWLHLQLGNKCNWCGRTNQETKLEIDHVLPVIRRANGKVCTFYYTLGDYLHGEPLRLLCKQCHEVRHSF